MVISALGLIIPRRDSCFPCSLDFSLLSEDPVNVIGNSVFALPRSAMRWTVGTISHDARGLIVRSYQTAIEFGLRGGAKTEIINETLRISPQPKAQPLKCNQPADDVGCSKYLSELAL